MSRKWVFFKVGKNFHASCQREASQFKTPNFLSENHTRENIVAALVN